jgi:membrane protease subunit HflK
MRYVLAAVVLGVAGYFLTGVTQVRPGERAVVRRFGRVVATPGPGLWIGLPWGMDRLDRVPVDRVRRVVIGYQPDDDDVTTTPPGQLLTGDHNLVNIQVGIHYSVDDAQVVAYVVQTERVDDLVARAAETVLTEWVAGQGIDDVLIQGKMRLPRLLVEQIQERIAGYDLGIVIRDADVAHLFPPQEVKPAFDEVTRAETSIQTRIHEARQEAANVLRLAETEKFRIEQETRAYQNERLRLAQAEAGRFEQRRAQYHRLRKDNPHFLAGIWWDEIGKLFASMKENGRLDLLDNHLAGDGLDITVFPPSPKRR